MDLDFRPWITKRATLHEYFFLSRSMFQTARSTKNSSLAARLTGESVELAIKAFLVLAGREPQSTHRIGDCLNEIPELKGLMANLWGNDLDFVIQMVDEDINTSQMRYGAAGSYVDKKTKLIAAAAAARAETWSDEISELYWELMSSLREGIWENYPEERKAVRRISLYPIFKGEPPKEGVYPNYPKSLFGFILQPEVNEVETKYYALIPIDRLPSGGSKDYWVRVRINRDTAVDQQVIRKRTGMQLASLRWIGRPVDGVRLRLYEARSRIQPL